MQLEHNDEDDRKLFKNSAINLSMKMKVGMGKTLLILSLSLRLLSATMPQTSKNTIMIRFIVQKAALL